MTLAAARRRRHLVQARTSGRSQQRARRRCTRSTVRRARHHRHGAPVQAVAAAPVGVCAEAARQAFRRWPAGHRRVEAGTAHLHALPGQPPVRGAGAAAGGAPDHQQPGDRIRPRRRHRRPAGTAGRGDRAAPVHACQRAARRRGAGAAEGGAPEQGAGADLLEPPARRRP
ncbi:hypothetical protein G6F40_014206 [Rhizopus arrhizus]|nr:hypothetical protein G6F40_014206 [Rhizopus arrhizus]